MEQSNDRSDLRDSIKELTSEVRRLKSEVSELRHATSSALDEVRTDLAQELEETRIGDRRHITNTGRDVVRQTEAMWQLFQKIPAPRASMPPSGGFPMEGPTILHLSVLLEELQPRTILELGGGTSTIWMGYLTEQLGTTIISIDHLKEYGDVTQEYVHRHGFSDRIDCRIAPLTPIVVDNRTYEWYSTYILSDVSEIDLLLVDGPPESTGERARFPALPMLHEKLSPSAVVLLDDTHREDEKAILQEWSSFEPGYEVNDSGVSRLGVLRPVASTSTESTD